MFRETNDAGDEDFTKSPVINGALRRKQSFRFAKRCITRAALEALEF